MGDSVDQDIRLLGEKNWKNLVLNREEWKKRLKIFKKERRYFNGRGTG
jgi:hypothetical protein